MNSPSARKAVCRKKRVTDKQSECQINIGFSISLILGVIQGVFLPHAQCSWHRLRFHRNPEENKAVKLKMSEF